jgi:predicted AAA+ superfamily ATPase
MHKQRMLWARLSIYRGLLEQPAIKQMIALLDILRQEKFDLIEAADACHQFMYVLSDYKQSFKEHLLDLILHDENAFSRECELKEYKDISPVLLKTVQNDLKILREIYHFDFGRIDELINPGKSWVAEICDGPQDARKQPDLAAELAASGDWRKHMESLYLYYHVNGAGLVSRYRALRWDGSRNRLVAVASPDPVVLKDLVGYVSQKEQICRNTMQFLNGCPANNILLYGSRGTGKSSMVKALLNEYGNQGLRLVEVTCDYLESLPEIMALLRRHSLKFIIFIDDLSFEDYETRYKGLKAVMEGSLAARADNVLIYATSNRRHLVREFHSDRNAAVDDEIHSWDTVQEKLSLSDRFGLTVTFPTPTQQQYLDIVEKLVADRNLNLDPEFIRQRALAWERSHHGPSGRTARQFVDSLGDGLDLI